MSSDSVLIEAYNNSIPEWLNVGCNNLLINNNFNVQAQIVTLNLRCQGGAATPVNVEFVKIGQIIHMTIPAFTLPVGSSGGVILSVNTFPSEYWPGTPFLNVGFCNYTNVGSASPPYPGGLVTVRSNGILQINGYNAGGWPLITSSTTFPASSYSWIYGA